MDDKYKETIFHEITKLRKEIYSYGRIFLKRSDRKPFNAMYPKNLDEDSILDAIEYNILAERQTHFL